MENNNYQMQRKEWRLQGRYYSGNPVYIQGYLSLSEALIAFKALGNIQIIQSCSKGRRVTIWDKKNEWGKLEQNLLKIR